MGLLESVRHFTYLLSEENLQFVNGQNSKDHEHLKHEIEGFSKEIEDGLAMYKPQQNAKQKSKEAPDWCHNDDIGDDRNVGDDKDPIQQQPASSLTADAASRMFATSPKVSHKNGVVKFIDDLERTLVIDTAKRCLAWAYAPTRSVVPGTEKLTKDEVW